MGIIKKQGIYNTIISYIGILIGFVNLIIIQPLFLTPEEIGLTRVLFSASSLIAVFLPMGIGNIIFRYFPKFRDPDKKHHGFFGFILLFPAAGLLVVTVLLFLLKDIIISQYIVYSKLFTEFYDYILPFSLVLGLISILNIYASALFRTIFPTLLNEIVIRIFTVIVISAYYLRWIDLDAFIISFVLVYSLQLFILVIYIFSIDRPGFKIDFKVLKENNVNSMLKYGLLLSFASIASLGLRYLDSIIIGKYMPLSFVGIYTIAAFIPAIMEAPLNSLDKIAYSKIAYALAHNNREEIKEIYYKSSRYLLLIGGLLFLGININIHSLLSFLPVEYSQGTMVVLIISIGTLFNLASGANNSLIYSSQYYRFGAFLLIFLIVVAFINNILLIPIMGIEGAALATAISTFLNSLLRFIFIFVVYKLQPYDFKTLSLVLLIAFCGLINLFLPALENAVLDILFRSFVITLLYGLGIYLLKIATELHSFIPFLKR